LANGGDQRHAELARGPGQRGAQQREFAPRRGDVLADRRPDLDLGLQHLVGDALAQALPAALHEALGRRRDQIVAGGIDQQILLLEAKTEGRCGEWHGPIRPKLMHELQLAASGRRMQARRSGRYCVAATLSMELSSTLLIIR
jgi:hypothetical protein